MKSDAKKKSKIWTIIMGVLAGPLEILITVLILNTQKSEFGEIFKILGSGIGFILIYRIIQVILAKVIYKDYVLVEEAIDLFCVVCEVSISVTWFIMWYMEGDGIVSAIILTIVFVVFQAPIFLRGGGKASEDNTIFKEKEQKNEMKVENAYLEDKFGNITGTVNTIKYNGKYGSYESTEIRDNFGNIKGKIDKF